MTDRARLTMGLLRLYTLESSLTGGLCCDSNNVEGTNSPTLVVSQRGFTFIRRKKFFPRKVSFKGQNCEVYKPERTIPHVTDRALVCNNGTSGRGRGLPRFSVIEVCLDWLWDSSDCTHRSLPWLGGSVVVLIMWRAPIILHQLWVKGYSCL